MRISDIRIDTDAVEAGAWVSGIPDLPGIDLFTRGIRNQTWIDLENRLLRSKSRGFANLNLLPEYRTMTSFSADAITNQCLLDTCLMDWRGVDDAYSYELARKLIFEPEFWLFRSGLLYAASRVGRPTFGAGEVAIVVPA